MDFIEHRCSRANELSFVAAGLDTMGACPIWDARMTGYLGCRALMTANAKFGSYAQIENDKGIQGDILERQHGTWWRKNPEAAAIIAPLDAAFSAAEDAHCEQFEKPFWKASVDLAMTPAPTIRAALFKVELVREDELDNDDTMPREPMEVVAEDFARLAAQAEDPVSRYHRALDGFSHGEIDEAAYVTAIDALDAWVPATPSDLLRKFLAVFSDGATPHEARIALVMNQAAAVFGKPAPRLHTV